MLGVSQCGTSSQEQRRLLCRFRVARYYMVFSAQAGEQRAQRL